MNEEFKNKLKKWFIAAGIRAIRTFCQTAASMYVVGQAMLEINWKHVVSVAGAACIFSFIMSVAGLPELEDDKEEQGDESE